jgi:RHS repeat-associated protein
VTDPNGNITTYLYDDFGRMLRQTSPVTGLTTYGYDPAGNLTQTADANGATTTRTFDALGRMSAATSTRGSATETVAWSYDGAAPFGRGRLVQMIDPAGSTSYAYDRRGLLIDEAREQSGHSYETPYRYDVDGNRTTVGNVSYTFDYAGRPLSAQTDVPLVQSANYLPFGPLTSLQFANGTTKTMTYDARYRPLTNVLSAGASTLSSHTYGYDATGNITSIADVLDATYNRTFGYDDLSRLTSANSGSSLWGAGAYSYDTMGNMLTSTLGSDVKSFSYQGTTPKLASATGFGSMSYDAAGNESHAGTYDWQYSPRNLRIAEGYSSGAYSYDGRGVRVGRQWTDLTTLSHDTLAADWLYSPDLHLLNTQFYRSTGYGYWEPMHTRQIVWFGNLPVAQYDFEGTLDALEPTASLRYTFTDHLGTPILQTDEGGSVTWRAEYEPYGTVHTFVAGTRQDQPLRFPGQEDAYMTRGDVGDYYNIFRWYRSGWGRYTQGDPLGLDGGIDLFAYAYENPILFADPSGLKVQVCCRTIPAFSLAGAHHCYFHFDSGSPSTIGLHGTYSLFGFILAGLGLDKGIVREDADFDRYGPKGGLPPTCGPWANCKGDQCVKDASKYYPSPSRYFFLGPNSNTFAHTISQACGVTPPSVAAPGW